MKSATERQPDETYGEAARRAMGAFIADVFLGMRDRGLDKETAQRLTEAWIWAQFSKGSTDDA